MDEIKKAAGPYTIGLTGPTGSGKSSLRPVFESRGFEMLDSDIYARRVTAPGSPALAELADEFGGDIILPDGRLDRALLARRAFSSERGRQRLNGLTHPHIVRMLLEDADAAHRAGRHAVIDAPLLFEAGLERACDFTIAVIAPAKIRLRRIMERDGIDSENARLRINAQKDDLYYISRADRCIVNDGSEAELERKAGLIIDRLINGGKRGDITE